MILAILRTSRKPRPNLAAEIVHVIHVLVQQLVKHGRGGRLSVAVKVRHCRYGTRRKSRGRKRRRLLLDFDEEEGRDSERIRSDRAERRRDLPD